MQTSPLSVRVSDAVTSFVGSWQFISCQSFFFAVWVLVNAMHFVGWDPYPFILMNLLLSFQAAYTAPFIMMSQNRQAARDRDHVLAEIYDIKQMQEINNLRTEVEELNQKVDLILEMMNARQTVR